MNKITKTFIVSFITLCFPLTYLNAQKASRQDSVAIMKVINPDIYHILDSIIEHEKKCNYYTDDMIFDIFITNEYIQFSSIGSIQYYLGTEYGLFFHKNHIIFVEGIKDETLFVPTPYKILYEFDVSTNYVDSNGVVNLYIYNDDSYSYWIYKYENRKFIFDGISTYCE